MSDIVYIPTIDEIILLINTLDESNYSLAKVIGIQKNKVRVELLHNQKILLVEPSNIFDSHHSTSNDSQQNKVDENKSEEEGINVDTKIKDFDQEVEEEYQNLNINGNRTCHFFIDKNISRALLNAISHIKWDSVETILTQQLLVETNQNNVFAMLLFDILYFTGKYIACQKLLETWLSSNSLEHNLYQGMLYFKLQHFTSALNVFTRLIQRYPNCLQGFVYKILCLKELTMWGEYSCTINECLTIHDVIPLSSYEAATLYSTLSSEILFAAQQQPEYQWFAREICLRSINLANSLVTCDTRALAVSYRNLHASLDLLSPGRLCFGSLVAIQLADEIETNGVTSSEESFRELLIQRYFQ